jgi:hypothetical protein
LALAAASLCLTFHCAPITHSLVYGAETSIGRRMAPSLYGLKLAIDQKISGSSKDRHLYRWL